MRARRKSAMTIRKEKINDILLHLKYVGGFYEGNHYFSLLIFYTPIPKNK